MYTNRGGGGGGGGAKIEKDIARIGLFFMRGITKTCQGCANIFGCAAIYNKHYYGSEWPNTGK
jgi:hypothetical protein